MKTNYGDRIKKILDDLDISQRDLALRMGVTSGYVSHLITGRRKPGREVLVKLGKALQLPISSFLDDGNNFSFIGGIENSSVKNQLPLISWVQAGSLHEAIDLFQPGDADRFIPYDTKDPNAFALTVVGDSMEPEFKEKDIVFISPAIEAVSGNYVVARFNDKVTLKKLKILPDVILLIPLNTKYNDIIISGRERKNLKIIGKVVAKLVEF